MIEIAGADRYMTLDLHAWQIPGFFSIPGDVLTAFHLLTDHVKSLLPELKDPVVVAADFGFAKKGRNFAATINAPIAFIEKRRFGGNDHPEAVTIIGEVNDRDVIIVDDEVDTAGSVSQAVQMVVEKGARRVYLVTVHPVFSPPAVERLVDLPLTQIITTDTIPISAEKSSPLKDKLTALGSVAPTVVRARRTEDALASGRTLADAQHILQTEISPIDDFRSTAAYRREVAARLLAQFWDVTSPAR